MVILVLFLRPTQLGNDSTCVRLYVSYLGTILLGADESFAKFSPKFGRLLGPRNFAKFGRCWPALLTVRQAVSAFRRSVTDSRSHRSGALLVVSNGLLAEALRRWARDAGRLTFSPELHLTSHSELEHVGCGRHLKRVFN